MFNIFQRFLVNLMTSPITSLVISFIFVFLCFGIAYKDKDPSYISRAGGLIAMIGLFPTTRRFLRKGVEETISDLASVDGGGIGDEEIRKIERKEIVKDVSATRCGFWFVFIGTAIWAVGDVIYISIMCEKVTRPVVQFTCT